MILGLQDSRSPNRIGKYFLPGVDAEIKMLCVVAMVARFELNVPVVLGPMRELPRGLLQDGKTAFVRDSR
jgi:hypothetical protein